MQLRRILILPLGLSLLAACGRDPAARADTTDDTVKLDSVGITRRDSAAGYVVSRDSQDTGRKKDTTKGNPSRPKADTPRVDTARADTSRADSTAKPDSSAAPALAVRMIPGRPKRDSLSLTYALRVFDKQAGWPVKGPAPADGALLPQKRIVAFYGNPLSNRMGILGALPPNEMLAKLDEVAKEWETADPETPVQPALHLIVSVAQSAPGRDGKYRLRMDSAVIEKVYGWAQQKNALLFLDIQTGQSTVQEEVPPLMKFLERPNVHLAIDPEFHMHYDKEGVQPGKKIGTLSSTEINYAIAQLSKVVEEKKLPAKVLVVHRFTRPMVRGASQIRLDPRVQVVMDMDGWGAPWLKFDSYSEYIVKEPVQFTGFKLFYRNDTKRGDTLLTAAEVLQLRPRPIYIQYQ